MSRDITRRPRQDSNLRTRLRRPVLYPLSYEGLTWQAVRVQSLGRSDHSRDAASYDGRHMLPDPEPHDESDQEPVHPQVGGPLPWSLLPEGASRGPGGRMQI